MLHKIDATNESLGRLASKIAVLLRGKDDPKFQPHILSGAKVHVSNVGKIKYTGNKLENKIYYRYSGYPGGIYETNFTKLLGRHPNRVLYKAVRGMMPKGPLGYAMLRKLKVYAGATHTHSAQQPKPIDLLKA